MCLGVVRAIGKRTINQVTIRSEPSEGSPGNFCGSIGAFANVTEGKGCDRIAYMAYT